MDTVGRGISMLAPHCLSSRALSVLAWLVKYFCSIDPIGTEASYPLLKEKYYENPYALCCDLIVIKS